MNHKQLRPRSVFGPGLLIAEMPGARDLSKRTNAVLVKLNRRTGAWLNILNFSACVTSTADEHPPRGNPRNFSVWVCRTKPVCPEPRAATCDTSRSPHLRGPPSTGIECVYRGRRSRAPSVDPRGNPRIL